MLDLVAEHTPYRTELETAFQRVLDSGRFVLGPEVEAFEREIAAWIGVPHAIGVSNGSDALLLALQAVGVGPGDEVICPHTHFLLPQGLWPVWAENRFLWIVPSVVTISARIR